MAGVYEADLVANQKIQTLGDTIWIAQSTKVPFGRMLRRGKKPNGMVSVETVQEYKDQPMLGTLDGTDKTSYGHTGRESVTAYSMWLRTQGWQATKLSNLTRTAGVKREEAAKQKADDDLHLALMIERQILSDAELQQESGETPWQSRGLFDWLESSAQSVGPVPSLARPSSDAVLTGALDTISPDTFEAMVAAAALNIGMDVSWFGMVGIKLKRKMSLWGSRVPDVASHTIISRGQEVTDKRLSQVLDMFEFDGGTVKVGTSWNLLRNTTTGALTNYSSRSGAFVDLSMFELRFNQPPQSRENPDLGGGPRGYADAVFQLLGKNMAGMGMIVTDSDAT